MNQLLDSRLTEEGDEERKENSASTSTKEQEEETMALWNSVSLFDAEEEKTKGYEDVMETNVATRSQGVVKEDSLILSKIKRLQRNIKKKFQINPWLIRFQSSLLPAKVLRRTRCCPSQMKKR